MIWVIGFLAVVVVVFGVLIATGRLGGMAAEPIRDVYEPVLPTGSLTATDLQRLKLGVSAQGYSMSQVDGLLDRLAGEIAERDRIIGEQRADPPVEAREPDIGPDTATTTGPEEPPEAVGPSRPEPIGNNGDDR